MKTCEYCGKQIDYNHAFCNEDCENNTFVYHKKRKKFQTFFSTINILGFVVIMLGTFIGLISQILKLGLIIVGCGAVILGIIYIVLPYYGLDEQIRKKGIITATKTMRIIGIVASIIGVACLTGGLFV